jgi:zinc and cadmium transporter
LTLAWIVGATAVGGVLSVALAATASLTFLARASGRLVAFAVGVLLAAALVELIPEAAQRLPVRDVGLALLLGLVALFALEKVLLWRHAPLGPPGPAGVRRPLAALVVIGDGLHNFTDGLLVAAAFLESPSLGAATALAVLAHEIPQEIGDFAILLEAGCTRRQALLLNLASGSAAIVGGVVGYAALQGAEQAVPYAMAAAAASFLYIAVSDLLPLLQRETRPLDSAIQLALIGAGAVVVAAPAFG